MPPYGTWTLPVCMGLQRRIGAFLASCNKLQERREISPGVPGYRRRGGGTPPYGCCTEKRVLRGGAFSP